MGPGFLNTLELRTKLTLLIGIVFVAPLLYASLYINNYISDGRSAEREERAREVAAYVAASPLVTQALSDPDAISREKIGQYLDILAAATKSRYIIPLDQNGVCLYHPNERKIGERLEGGDEGRALQGETYLSSAMDSFGYTRRLFMPVRATDGTVLGAVTVGIMPDPAPSAGNKEGAPLQKVMFGAMMLGLFLAVLLARSIKNILFGLEPEEIATLLKERSAMLQMVNEGVVAVNLRGRVTLVNDEAVRILHKAGIDEPLQGKLLADYVPVAGIFRVMRSGVPEVDDEQNINGVSILASHMPVTINDLVVGAISTFRDMSEVRALAERITDINRYVDALRSQSHEFMNKLHVIMGLLNSGKNEELRAYIEDLIDTRTAEGKVIYNSVKDPVIAGFLSSKYSNARELGVRIGFTMQGVLPQINENALRNGLITILGNLVDNGLDAVQESPVKQLHVGFAIGGDALEISVSDTGVGMNEEETSRMFSKGYSTKGENRGLGLWLVLRTVNALDGSITVRSAPGGGTEFFVSLPLVGVCGEKPC